VSACAVVRVRVRVRSEQVLGSMRGLGSDATYRKSAALNIQSAHHGLQRAREQRDQERSRTFIGSQGQRL
jgi:hypothetical protein